jgi:hypothetical protein
MSFTSKYEIQEQTIKLIFTLETYKILLNPEDFQAWNDAIKNLKSVYNETIILTDK